MLCSRLKAEAKYDIIGADLSVANPFSDLMKLNKTWKEFIQDSDSYEAEDKEILMEVFTDGNKLIEDFDKI